MNDPALEKNCPICPSAGVGTNGTISNRNDQGWDSKRDSSGTISLKSLSNRVLFRDKKRDNSGTTPNSSTMKLSHSGTATNGGAGQLNQAVPPSAGFHDEADPAGDDNSTFAGDVPFRPAPQWVLDILAAEAPRPIFTPG